MKFDEIRHKFRRESFTQKDKRSRFERLMLLYDPRYPNLTEAWTREDIPSKGDFGGMDIGIGVGAHVNDGEYWAIQCKY